MGLKANILANYLGAGLIALAPLLALPWYLAALGPQQFGLISFITMLQLLLGIVDAGSSQALVREFSLRFHAGTDGKRDAATLLFGLERLYWGFALVAGVAVTLLSQAIAAHWLDLGDLPVSLGTYAICGAGVLFALQFPGSVYRSLLVGAEAQVTLNLVMLGGALARHLGAVLLLQCWPNIATYLAWHASISLAETLLRRRLAWRATTVPRAQLHWQADMLRPLWRTVAGLSGAAWLGALTVQMDKIVLSKMVDVQQFGYYAIAAGLAIGLLQLVYPLLQAILPRAVALRHEPDRLRVLCLRLLGWIAAVVLGSAVLYAALGPALLRWWLQDADAVAATHPLLTVLLAGTAMNAFYTVGYIHWLVHERVGRVLIVNAASLLLAAAAIPPLVARWGSIGAAFGWLSINLIGLVLSLEWLLRRRNERTA